MVVLNNQLYSELYVGASRQLAASGLVAEVARVKLEDGLLVS